MYVGLCVAGYGDIAVVSSLSHFFLLELGTVAVMEFVDATGFNATFDITWARTLTVFYVDVFNQRYSIDPSKCSLRVSKINDGFVRVYCDSVFDAQLILLLKWSLQLRIVLIVNEVFGDVSIVVHGINC